MAVVLNPDWSRYDLISVVEAAAAGNPEALADLHRRAEEGDEDARMAEQSIEAHAQG